MSFWGREQVEINREELYRMVWAEPVLKIAPRYGISDVALKKICVKLNVPVPPRGYWAKLANGRLSRKRALPKLKKGEAESVSIDKRPPRKSKEEGETPTVTGPQFWGHGKIAVSEGEIEVHRLLAPIQEAYATAVSGEDGLLRSRRKDPAPFSVGLENRDRALKILTTFISSLEQSGYTVTANADVFECDTPAGKVRFRIQETLKAVERNPTKEERERDAPWLRYYKDDDARRPRYYRQIANGLLSLTIEDQESLGVRKVWADTEKSRLENQLTSFASGIFRFAEVRRQVTEERERREREWEEQRCRRKEEEDRKRAEQTRRERVAEAMKSWTEAEKIREFARALEAEATRRFASERADDIIEWLRWLRHRSDWIDPLQGDLLGPFPPS